MLVRHPKKLVRPGQWVLAKVPTRVRERFGELDRDAVWLAVIPDYAPDDSFKDSWRWWYSLAFRWPESVAAEKPCYYTHKQLWHKPWVSDSGSKYEGHYSYLNQYDFDLISMAHDCRSRTKYDPNEYALDREGKCGFLYTPASDNLEDCPGPAYDLYQCDKCNERMEPWSDDEGNLLCPNCDCMTGIYCDDETVEQMERARALASFVGPEARRHLDQTFTWMAREVDCLSEAVRCNPRRLRLYSEDKFSFGFALQYFVDGAWKNGMNGGIICHGPHVKIGSDGAYEFTTWDYEHKCSRPSTEAEIRNISWSTHT